MPGYNPPYAGYTTSPQIGGASGSAITNNTNITWVATGTRLGAVVAGSADAPLTLASITPNVGAAIGDTAVVLTGTGFGPGATVTIGGVAAVGCSTNSSTMITCLTPASSVGAKTVVVSFAGGSATLTNGFTYQALGITAISPAIGSFAGGTVVTVTGTGFAPGTWAAIGGAAATACVVNSSTSLTCVTGPNSVGVKNVVVGLDQSSVTLSNAFTYQALSLTAVSPNQGGTAGGMAVTLTGTGFAPGASVTLGGAAATGCAVASSTAMTCTTPASTAGVKDVVVSLAGSNGALSGGFTYLSAYVFSPTLSANTANYNLQAAAVAAGWNPVIPLTATVTINSGVVVGSSSTSTYAFDTGTGFPSGSTLTLINGGFIVGAGGQGGNGGGYPGYGNASAGAGGGPALRAQVALTITNNGTIGGGGGGGGGNSPTASWLGDYCGGPGGGGGAGSVAGGGSSGGTTPFGGAYNAPGGSAGGLSSGGAPGSYVDQCTGYGVAGGRGGNLGQSGNGGSGAGGGTAGSAIVGNSNITWTVTGTRLGALQ